MDDGIYIRYNHKNQIKFVYEDILFECNSYIQIKYVSAKKIDKLLIILMILDLYVNFIKIHFQTTQNLYTAINFIFIQ